MSASCVRWYEVEAAVAMDEDEVGNLSSSHSPVCVVGGVTAAGVAGCAQIFEVTAAINNDLWVVRKTVDDFVALEAAVRWRPPVPVVVLCRVKSQCVCVHGGRAR